MEEGLGQSIACAAHACDILVDDVTVMKLVSDARVKLKYQHLITNSFVEVSFEIVLASLFNLKYDKSLRKLASQFTSFIEYLFNCATFMSMALDKKYRFL